MFFSNLCVVILASLMFLSGPAQAQFDGGSGGGEDDIEALYDSHDRNENRRTRQSRRRAKPVDDVGNLSQLANLAPFEDIAVIQRRFLPKTGRFEINGSIMATLNNPFFTNLGAGLQGGYYFSEQYGVELTYLFLSNSAREVTTNLENKQSVRTQSLVTPENFMGASFKWNPIYGKMTWLNQRIVPFDLYFKGGFGMTGTAEKRSEPTLSLGTGQMFSISKSMAFRWDFLWNFYSSQTTAVDGSAQKTNQDDLYISIGMSFFFPEATYR